MAAGMSESMVWVVDEEQCEAVWWRYRQVHAATMPSQSSGRVRIHASDHSKLRALVAYDVKKLTCSDGVMESVPFLVVASADGLETLQLATADGSEADKQFKSWGDLKIEPAQTTVLCVQTEDDYSNVMLCNRPGELAVFRHDLSSSALLDLIPEVFEDISLSTRLGMGNSSLGNTLRRFIGSEPSAACPRYDIRSICSRVKTRKGAVRQNVLNSNRCMYMYIHVHM